MLFIEGLGKAKDSRPPFDFRLHVMKGRLSRACGLMPAAFASVVCCGASRRQQHHSSLLLFVSVLVHELAHSLVARSRGIPVNNITLFIFGGVSNIEREPTTAGIEFQLAFVGPLTSLVIGAICFLLQLPLHGSNSPLEGVLFYLAATNIVLGIFNLIPGFPLDGGRVLHSIIWKLTSNSNLSTHVALLTGQVVAYLFILLGIWIFFTGDILDGLWFGFIGWFLLSAAQSAIMQVMRREELRGAL